MTVPTSPPLKLTNVLLALSLLFLGFRTTGQELRPEEPNIRPDPEYLKVFISQGFIPSDLVIDRSGNIHLAGTFQGHLSWEGGQQIPMRRTFSERSPNNFFLIKQDSSGQVLWTNFAEGDSRIARIQVDDSGNVYVVGEVFSRSLILTSSDSSCYILDKPDTDISRGIFISKYDSEGKILKLKFYSEGKMETPGAMLVNSKGEMIIGGVNFYREGNERKRNYLLLKFDPNLDLIWKLEGDTIGRSQITSLCLDRFGNIYATGGYTSHLRIGDKVVEQDHEDQKIFVARFDCNGDLKWLNTSLGTPEGRFHEVGIKILCDGRGRLFLAGNSSSRLYLVRLNRRGRSKWCFRSSGRSTYISDIFLDKKGDLFICGNGYGGEMPSSKKDTAAYTSKGSTDFFLARYDKRGRRKYLMVGGGEGTDYADAMAIFGDKIYVLGHDLGGPNVQFSEIEIPSRFPVMWWGRFDEY